MSNRGGNQSGFFEREKINHESRTTGRMRTDQCETRISRLPEFSWRSFGAIRIKHGAPSFPSVCICVHPVVKKSLQISALKNLCVARRGQTKRV